MKLRFARTLVLMVGLTALAPVAMAVPPTAQPPRVNPLAGAQKAVKDAQANLDAARRQLLVIRHKVEAQFASKPEFKAGKDAMDKAKNDYDAETRKVAANLEKDPAYAAQKAKRDKAQAIIDQAHNPPVATGSGDDPVKLTNEQIDEAVKDHQDAALAMIAMQKQAEQADPNFAALMQKRTEANAAWEALQAQVDEALKTDPAYPPAQSQVDSAEQSLKSAKDGLAAATKQMHESEAAAHSTPTPTRKY